MQFFLYFISALCFLGRLKRTSSNLNKPLFTATTEPTVPVKAEEPSNATISYFIPYYDCNTGCTYMIKYSDVVAKPEEPPASNVTTCCYTPMYDYYTGCTYYVPYCTSNTTETAPPPPDPKAGETNITTTYYMPYCETYTKNMCYYPYYECNTTTSNATASGFAYSTDGQPIYPYHNGALGYDQELKQNLFAVPTDSTGHGHGYNTGGNTSKGRTSTSTISDYKNNLLNLQLKGEIFDMMYDEPSEESHDSKKEEADSAYRYWLSKNDEIKEEFIKGYNNAQVGTDVNFTQRCKPKKRECAPDPYYVPVQPCKPERRYAPEQYCPQPQAYNIETRYVPSTYVQEVQYNVDPVYKPVVHCMPEVNYGPVRMYAPKQTQKQSPACQPIPTCIQEQYYQPAETYQQEPIYMPVQPCIPPAYIQTEPAYRQAQSYIVDTPLPPANPCMPEQIYGPQSTFLPEQKFEFYAEFNPMSYQTPSQICAEQNIYSGSNPCASFSSYPCQPTYVSTSSSDTTFNTNNSCIPSQLYAPGQGSAATPNASYNACIPTQLCDPYASIQQYPSYTPVQPCSNYASEQQCQPNLSCIPPTICIMTKMTAANTTTATATATSTLVDPKAATSAPADPKAATAVNTDPAVSNVTAAYQARIDPATTDPATTDPKSADPATTDAKSADPATADAKSADPATTDARSADPATSDEKSADPATSDANAASFSASETLKSPNNSTEKSDGEFSDSSKSNTTYITLGKTPLFTTSQQYSKIRGMDQLKPTDKDYLPNREYTEDESTTVKKPTDRITTGHAIARTPKSSINRPERSTTRQGLSGGLAL